jgi:ADP-heptose:LPS heptosyltransferase
MFLDKCPGFVLCALLTAVNKLVGPKAREVKREEICKILFMKFWGMGSILLLSPSIQEFRKTFPDARLVFLTMERNREISNSLHLFDEVITLDVDHGWRVFIKGLLSVIRFFWRQRFDMVVDYEFFTRFSAIMTFLTFSPIKVGYHAWETWRGNIHTIKVPFNRYWHIMDNFFNLGSYIGLAKRAELSIVKPAIPPEDRAAVKVLLQQHGVHGSYLCVHVNASDLSIERRWPYENFIALLGKLVNRYDLSIILIGSTAEKDFVREILAQINHPAVIDFVGKLPVTQLACLFEGARLIISNDSGPLHLAVAMEAPTLSFFGPETPVIYGPRGKHHTVFFKNIDCSPCMNVHDRKSVHCYWKRPKCMELITVDEVYRHITERLGNEKERVSWNDE